MFATCDFVHLSLEVKAGDEFPADHPMVELRPDLFSDTPPAKGKTPKPPKE